MTRLTPLGPPPLIPAVTGTAATVILALLAAPWWTVIIVALAVAWCWTVSDYRRAHKPLPWETNREGRR